MRISRGAGLVWPALLVPFVVSATPSLLNYATYLNGAYSNAIAADSSGNTFIAGNGFVAEVDSAGAHVVNSIKLTGKDVTAIKLDASGNIVIAGSAGDAGFVAKYNAAGQSQFFNILPNAVAAIAVDGVGNIYATGSAPTAKRGTDVFVTKLNSAGAQVYSATIGGTGDDTGRAIAVDGQGDAFITGDTSSSDFPVTAGAAQTKFGGAVPVFGGGSLGDAFVAKLDPTGAQVLFATYWGGAAPDIAYAIAVDSSGNAYIAGATSSSDFPTTTGSLQSKYAGPAADPADPDPAGDAFVVKFSPLGAVLWSGLWGGARADAAYAIALDSARNVYIAGGSESTDFPRAGNAIPTCRTTGGPFVAELDASGSKLLHATGMSGLGYDTAFAVTVDAAGIAYIAGETESQVFLATPGAAQTKYSGDLSQAFIAAINFDAPVTPYAACVLNAASYAAGNAASFPLGTVAPGEIVSVFGAGLGSGASVAFDGIPAPLIYAGANQINAVVPFAVHSNGTAMTVQFNGQSYGPVAMPVTAAVPGIFTIDGSGHGQAAVLNQDGTLNSIANPASRGSIITFYACGAGAMTPAVTDGAILPLTLPLPAPVLAPSVSIRGVDAAVKYSGAAPGSIAGLVQVNVEVPTSIDFGNLVPLSLNLGQFSTQFNVTIAVK